MLLLIRIVFWTLALVVGASCAWDVRHDVISDGISYLEIATNYVRGDWMNAVNAYWSPLFSWCIAIALAVLHASAYWEVAVMHLVIFVAFLASLIAFEFFLRELLLVSESDRPGLLPKPVVYTVAYSVILFAGLSTVGMSFCSPDMPALSLTLLLLALVLRISRTGGTEAMFVAFGVLCALCYFARTALLPSLAISFIVVLLLLRQKHLPKLYPAILIAVTSALLMAPYVIAISKKQGGFTLGDSGALNYAWELDGAHRWVHWQGEPYDIGKPAHPTTFVISSPKTFTFARPIQASYPPWYDPAYWYAGVKPRLHLGRQLWVWLVNMSVFLYAFVRSPVIISLAILVPLAGFRSWARQLLRLWPILLPTVVAAGVYSLVYVEKRYVAANLVVLWIACLVSLRVDKPWTRRLACVLLVSSSLLFVGLYAVNRLRWQGRDAFSDLIHRRERFWNVNYLIAERLHALGLRPGDAVAYIGPGMNAEWARLAGLRIVAEIPLMYSRNRRLLNNSHINDPSQIKAFFHADAARQQQVFEAFRNAGAKIVVTDGFFSKDWVSNWPRVLPPNEEHVPQFSTDSFSQVNSRYLVLNDSMQYSSASLSSSGNVPGTSH
jgi:hypothetical protein